MEINLEIDEKYVFIYYNLQTYLSQKEIAKLATFVFPQALSTGETLTTTIWSRVQMFVLPDIKKCITKWKYYTETPIKEIKNI